MKQATSLICAFAVLLQLCSGASIKKTEESTKSNLITDVKDILDGMQANYLEFEAELRAEVEDFKDKLSGSDEVTEEDWDTFRKNVASITESAQESTAATWDNAIETIKADLGDESQNLKNILDYIWKTLQSHAEETLNKIKDLIKSKIDNAEEDWDSETYDDAELDSLLNEITSMYNEKRDGAIKMLSAFHNAMESGLSDASTNLKAMLEKVHEMITDKFRQINEATKSMGEAVNEGVKENVHASADAAKVVVDTLDEMTTAGVNIIGNIGSRLNKMLTPW